MNAAMHRIVSGAIALAVVSNTFGADAEKSITVAVEVNNTHFDANGDDPPCASPLNGAVSRPGYEFCKDVCADIPAGAVVTHVLLSASDKDGGASGGCLNGTTCSISWSKWWSTPEIDGTHVCGHFKNWSSGNKRTGTMINYYR
ncbi:hypothetical protein [Caballeronia sp. M23-90]